MTHSCYHNHENSIWNSSIRNTDLLNPFLWPWSLKILYIVWTFSFKTRATIVQTLFIIHNSECRRKTSIISRSEIPLLPPTTLNPYYKSVFRIPELQRRATAFTFYNLPFIIFPKEFWEESLLKKNLPNPILIAQKFQSLIAGVFSLIEIFFSISLLLFFLQKEIKMKQ